MIVDVMMAVWDGRFNVSATACKVHFKYLLISETALTYEISPFYKAASSDMASPFCGQYYYVRQP